MKHIFTTLAVALFLAGGLTAQVKTRPIGNFEATADDPDAVINLAEHFADPNDPQAHLSFEMTNNSVPEVASIAFEDQEMIVNYQDPGQTSIIIKASSNESFVSDTFIVGVRPVIEDGNTVVSFDDLSLGPESYWNGSDESGSFASGPAVFSNSYNPDWASWSGWAYSSMTDNTTPGYGNQYSAFSNVRLDSSGGKNYGISFASPWSDVQLDPHSDQEVKGFFITNSTWAALSMKFGDAFSKKFGGADGNDPDWLKLTITGRDRNWERDTVEFFLADYTFEDNAQDYIIETWQWVDLSPLGKVNQLQFTMSSTDNNDWGMITPAYFCMDNLVVVPDAAPEISGPMEDISGEPGTKQSFDLRGVFTDPDDDNASIEVYLVDGSWDSTIVHPTIDGDTLQIDLLATGDSHLALAAFSNGKVINEDFHINVMLTGINLPGLDGYGSGQSGSQKDAIGLLARPNPTDGQFIIDSRVATPGKLSIIDPSGRLVQENNSYVPGTPLDISNAPAGIYLVKFSTSGQIFIERIIRK